DEGLKYIRRELNGEKIYYIVNHSQQRITKIPLNFATAQVTVYNPLNGEVGKAKIQQQNNTTIVYLEVEPGKAFILKTGEMSDVADLVYTTPIGKPTEITTDWTLRFL